MRPASACSRNQPGGSASVDASASSETNEVTSLITEALHVGERSQSDMAGWRDTGVGGVMLVALLGEILLSHVGFAQ